MHRVAPLLFLGGVLLLVTSLRAPAASVPGVAAPMPADYFDEQATGVLVAVEQEAAKLRDRIDRPVEAPVAERNPFRFGDRPDEADAGVGPGALDAAPVELPPPVLVLPRIVAMTTAAGESPVRRAFVAFEGTVVEVAAGSVIGDFVVQTIGVTVIEVRHEPTGETHVIHLR
jgi:hypothetical protein